MKKSYLKYILHAVILIGLGVAAVRYLNGEEILTALQEFSYFYALPLLLLSAAYILLKGARFVVLMRPVSDLPWDTMVIGYIAGTAATLVPGGVAARAGLMKQVGVPIGKSGPPVAFSSILDQVSFVLGALLAALWFEPARLPVLIFLGIMALVVLILLIPAVRAWLSRAMEWLATRLKFLEEWQHFLTALEEVVTWRIMLVTFGLTILGLGMQIVMLDLSLRGFDLQVAYPTLFLAYILPAMLGRLSALPAGIGLTEAGMVGFLASYAGIDLEVATAAAAIFRIGTVFFQALLGALIYFISWGGEVKQVTQPGQERLQEEVE